LNALADWQRLNARRIALLQKRAADVAAAVRVPERQRVRAVEIPLDANPALEEFLVERARLFNEITTRDERLRESPGRSTEVLADWEKANRAAFAAQDRRGAGLSAQNPVVVPSLPREPAIPQDASPDLRALLLERHALLLQRAAIEQRFSKDEGTARVEAVLRWQAATRTQFDELATKAAQLGEK
jgi:hypothetical protein